MQLFLEFLSSISWPLITIVVFLYLKEPLKNLINNIKKIGYGNTGIETGHNTSQNEGDNSILEILGDGKDFSYLDNLMAKFSQNTLDQIDKTIENETSISKVDGLQNKYDRIYKYAKTLVLVKNAERIYSLIYGSQIRLLQRLNHTTTETKNDLKFYYDTALKNYPNLYETYSYESYLSFLSNNELITIINENVTITTIGKDFLRYIIEANLSTERLY